MTVEEASKKIALVKNNISKVIVGKENSIDLILTCLISKGHILLEDLPGTGKTTLAKALALSTDASFSRIQFTPDLLPADITGINIYNRAEEKFNFVPGPIMTTILLADEINRATPRTQSALLEAMQERQVTVDGVTRELSDNFFVIATQNPVETTGTFPLPEAELDRFMMQISLGTLSVEDEVKMLQRFENDEPLYSLENVVSEEEISEISSLISAVYVHPDLLKYIADISYASRTDISAFMGISPRGSMALLKASKAYALIQGREYVLPDDIKTLAAPVLAHRMLFANRKDKAAKDEYIRNLVDKIEVPTEEFNVK